MNYDQIRPAFREALGAHEGLRKLGFPSSEIFVHLNPNGEMFVVLRTEGRQFGVTVGWVEDLTKEEWEKLWTETVEAVRAERVDQPTMDRIWQESFVFAHKNDFVASILHKGIKIPNLNSKLH